MCSAESVMAPHSTTLAWRIPWTEEPGRLQSMGSRRVRYNWVTSLSLFTFHALEKEMATHSSVLAWRIPGTGEPGGLPSLGSHRFGHDWSGLAAAAADVFWPQKLGKKSRVKHLLTHCTWLLIKWPSSPGAPELSIRRWEEGSSGRGHG